MPSEEFLNTLSSFPSAKVKYMLDGMKNIMIKKNSSIQFSYNLRDLDEISQVRDGRDKYTDVRCIQNVLTGAWNM